MITYVLTADKEVYLLTIYDKTDIESVDDKALKKMIKEIRSEE